MSDPMPEFIFWLFSMITLGSALGVVFSRQAMQSACWMFALLLGLSGLMAFLGAYLLALLTIIVYLGAILVLFTFVIMFMGQRAPMKQIGRMRLLGALGAGVTAIVVLWPIFQDTGSALAFGAGNTLPQNTLYGAALFGHWALASQLVGWILLWVSVGVFNIVGTPSSNKKEAILQ